MALCGFQLGGFNLGAGSALPNRARLLLNKVPGASALYMPDRKLSSRIINGVRVLKDAGDPKPEADFSPAQIANSELLTFLDGADGKTPILYDWSGNGINATQTTVADQPFIATAGVLEEGLRFAGGQWLGALDGKTFFDPTTYAFSFSFWARTTTLGANQNYCGVLNDGTNTFFWARLGFPDRLLFTLRKNGNVSQMIDIASAVSINTWLHYTGVHTGTQIILYKDGNEIGRENIGAGTLSALQYPFAIGSANSRGTISSDFLQGSLTGFGIWPRVLTPAEINTVKTLTDPTA
jgi:hypothetical protein